MANKCYYRGSDPFADGVGDSEQSGVPHDVGRVNDLDLTAAVYIGGVLIIGRNVDVIQHALDDSRVNNVHHPVVVRVAEQKLRNRLITTP